MKGKSIPVITNGNYRLGSEVVRAEVQRRKGNRFESH